MYWQIDEDDKEKPLSDNVLEVVFAIHCRSLPVDHAYALSQCVQNALPWFKQESLAGMHTIHVAESANGWMRPDGPDQVLHPSRRSKFILRVPKSLYEQTASLVGQTFIIDDHTLTITKASSRKLSDITTLFSRYVVSPHPETEDEFIERMVSELEALHILPKKLLCGIPRSIDMPQGELLTRSLLLADLSKKESVKVQESGLGSHRYMGCGLFVAHKDVNQISEDLG